MKTQIQKPAGRKQALAALPVQFGFEDTETFIRALWETAGRKRACITEAQRAEVKRLLAAGQTGAEISAAVGISPAEHPRHQEESRPGQGA